MATNRFILEHTMLKIRSAVKFLENTNIVNKHKKEFGLLKKIDQNLILINKASTFTLLNTCYFYFA